MPLLNTSPSEIPMLHGASAREFERTIDLLSAFPHIGDEGALAGTREMGVPGLPYIVVHRIETGDEDTLVILGVYHGAQLRPGQEPQ